MSRGLRLLFAAAIATSLTAFLSYGASTGRCYETTSTRLVEVQCESNGWVWAAFVWIATAIVALRLLHTYLLRLRHTRHQSLLSSSINHNRPQEGTPCA